MANIIGVVTAQDHRTVYENRWVFRWLDGICNTTGNAPVARLMTDGKITNSIREIDP